MSVEVLKNAVSAILNGGSAWTQRAVARNSAGLPVAPLNPDAVAWDVMGALIKAHHEVGEPTYVYYHLLYSSWMSMIPPTFKSRDVEAYNDVATWEEIAAVIGAGGSPVETFRLLTENGNVLTTESGDRLNTFVDETHTP